MAESEKKPGKRVVATNRRARFDYFLSDFTQAGLELTGTEIKSIRAGHVSLTGAFVDFKGGEAFVVGMQITPYKEGNIFNSDPMRDKKLLLHKREINKLMKQRDQAGYSVVPVELYISRGKAKLDIALGKGKKAYDKRAVIKERDIKRNLEKRIRQGYSGED